MSVKQQMDKKSNEDNTLKTKEKNGMSRQIHYWQSCVYQSQLIQYHKALYLPVLIKWIIGDEAGKKRAQNILTGTIDLIQK